MLATGLFLEPTCLLTEPHSWAASISIDELDAGDF
jgi:hypothetical protein